MGDFVTDYFKKQQSPTGPIGTQGDAFGTPNYKGSPYAFPYQRGTNLPWSYQKDEPLPQWNGQRPVDSQGNPTVGPGAVPMQTGKPGQYGGNISWFDPATGLFRDEYGRTKDSQFSAAAPSAWAALAALAAGNPGGMLRPEDFWAAKSSAYGAPRNTGAETDAMYQQRAAHGYLVPQKYYAAGAPRTGAGAANATHNNQHPGGGGTPINAPPQMMPQQQAPAQQMPQQQSPATANPTASPTPQASPVAPAQTSAGGLQQASGQGIGLAQIAQLFQALSQMGKLTADGGQGLGGALQGSMTLSPQILQQILKALSAQGMM